MGKVIDSAVERWNSSIRILRTLAERLHEKASTVFPPPVAGLFLSGVKVSTYFRKGRLIQPEPDPAGNV